MGFGHWWIIAIVLVIVLIVWGPGKLPDVGAGMGRAIREFRHASTEARDAMSAEGHPAPQATPSVTAAPSIASVPPPVSPNPGGMPPGESAVAGSTADEKRAG